MKQGVAGRGGIGQECRDSNRHGNQVLKAAKLASAIALTLTLAACASPAGETARTARTVAPEAHPAGPYVIEIAEPSRPRAVFEGLASWYGDYFHGRITANGEIFDQHKLTAAHPSLPLPSLARVTRLDTGRSVVVRVNDRGPFVGERVIDLSFAAAQALDFVDDGVTQVRIEALGPADPEDRAAPAMGFDPADGPPRFGPETREPVIVTAQR